MAFLIDRGIAAESEEEFDAEGDRYEELKNKLLGGQTMKYEEMEELLAAAKSKNDQKVIDVLKNVVDDPATDAVTESEKGPTKSELLDKLIKMCKPGSGLRIALEGIKDKFVLDESNTYVQDDNDFEAADDELWDAIDRLAERKDLTADECEWDAHAGVITLTYKNRDWYGGCGASMSGPAKPAGFDEGVEDDVESDLTKIHDEFLKSSGFDFEFAHDSVKTAIADAVELVKKDGDIAVRCVNPTYGDRFAADCVVKIPCKMTYGPAQIMEDMMNDVSLEIAAKKIQDACGGPGECSVRNTGRYLEIHADASKDWTAEIKGVLAQYPAFAGWKVSLIGGDGYVAEPSSLNEAELSQEEMDDIADMFAAYSGAYRGGSDIQRRQDRMRATADFMRRHAGELKQLLDQPSQAEGFGDFSRAANLEFDESEDPAGKGQQFDDFDTQRHPEELPGADEYEYEKALPDSLVNEAIETLRRMY